MRLKNYLIPVLICVLGCMLLVAGCEKSDSKKEPERKNVTVTDSIGRSIEMPSLLEKVVVINPRVAEAVRILKVQDKVIGVDESVQNNTYLDMQGSESVGKVFQPNYEKIVELKPQIVIAYASMGPGPEVAEKLEPAGIKVVLLDLFKPETYDADLQTLAKMFGKEKEAAAFLKWKAEKTAVLDKVKGFKKEQGVKSFIMTPSNFEKEIWKTYAGGSAAHQTIEMAGGINVAQELREDYPNVSPEWILQQNPGILLFPDYSKELLGYNINDFKLVEQFKEKVIKNKVLSKTDAVRKDRIYVIPNDLFGGDKSYLGALYLAKWFYPDQLKDLDPEKALKEYFEKWLNIPFRGKWAYPPASE